VCYATIKTSTRPRAFPRWTTCQWSRAPASWTRRRASAESEERHAKEAETLSYAQSSLKSLSELSKDRRTLEQAGTPEAQTSHRLFRFVFRARRELGAMTAVLNGIDAPVSTGGIGENAKTARERVA